MPPKGYKGYSKQVTDVKQGRPAIGVTKKVSLTLTEDDWSWLGDSINFGHANNYSELIRHIIQDFRGVREEG